MRYFNTHGPVTEEEHYVVPRARLVAELIAQIQQGKFFTIYAPRQMGKTTLLRRLRDVLREKPGYLPVTLSFQLFESWPVTRFLAEFGRLMARQILAQLQTLVHPRTERITTLMAEHHPSSYEGFWRFFDGLHELAPDLQVVLIIDEFDATPQKAISSLLQTWREIYLAFEPPRSLHSVILIGLQNIATLNLGRSSPFNIARQMQLAGFTLAQVRDLLGQYTAESGQPFAPGVIEKIHEQTGGQPFLVNRTAAILTEKIAPDRSHPITRANLERALRLLVKESNYNFETVQRHASEFHEETLRIIFGGLYKFTLNTPFIKQLHTDGVLRATSEGYCDIANPIYKRVLIDYLVSPELPIQGEMLANAHDFHPYTTTDGLQMRPILSHFRQFVERRGQEAFQITDTPQEATGQYLLMAYLEAITRRLGEGAVFTEIPSGQGRLDLIHVHRGQRYVVETKIWYGQKRFDEGIDRLADYLESEGQDTGYYVVFHARPRVYGKLTYKQLEFKVQRAGKAIYVYLVQLGEVFGEG
ncbi:MAG: AAA-like domain-containing protein [Anaerolineales bacterium]